MRLVIIGCEYSGTTTLGFRIRDWVHEELGGWVKNVHDHGKFPYTVTHEQEYTPVPSDFTVEEQEQLWALSTRSKETIMRHNVVYHASGMATMTGMRDSLMIGLHIEEAIYGELYLGFEGRRDFMKNMEDKILSGGTDAVLCHVTARPEVIRRRMAENPHPNGILKDQDVELVLQRFREEFERSRLMHKIELDTSDATVDETMQDFIRQIGPHLTDKDRAGMAAKVAEKRSS
jgi:hypothetical protein